MSRFLLALGAVAAIALPLLLGAYALPGREADMPAAGQATGLDETMLANAVSAQPLDLSPGAAGEPSREAAAASLEEMATRDREGAVALVRQALLDNPQILDEAIAALETARAAQEDALITQALVANADRLFDDEHASIMGNAQGTVTLVEFLDYNCSFCKRAHGDVMRLIEEQADLRVVVKDFPVLGPGSLEAAQVAVAFRSIGGDMAAFIDAMMTETNAPADAMLARAVALALGADETALDLALDSPSLMASIAEAYALAEQLGIGGTPAFVVGQQRLMGAVGFERLSEAIEAERARLSAL